MEEVIPEYYEVGIDYKFTVLRSVKAPTKILIKYCRVNKMKLFAWGKKSRFIRFISYTWYLNNSYEKIKI